MGLQEASIWLHDTSGDHQLTDEGYAMQPAIIASGTRMFYLMRTQLSQGQASGELWSMDLKARERQRVLPAVVITNYSLSRDERRVVFTTSGNDAGDGIWIADLDRRAPPRPLMRALTCARSSAGPEKSSTSATRLDCVA